MPETIANHNSHPSTTLQNTQSLQPVVIQPPTQLPKIIQPTNPPPVKNHPFGQWSVRETLGLVQWAYLNLKGSPYQIESWEGAASSLRYIGKCAHREAFYSAKNCCMRFLQLLTELPSSLNEKVIELCGENSNSEIKSAAEHGILLYGSAVPGNNTDKNQCCKHFSMFKKLIIFYAELRKAEILKELENYESEYKRFDGYLQKLNTKGLEEKEIVKLRAEMIKELKIKSSQFSKQVQASGLTLDSEPLIPVIDANGHVIPQKIIIKTDRTSPDKSMMIQPSPPLKITTAPVKSEFIVPEQIPSSSPVPVNGQAKANRPVQQIQHITDPSSGQVFRIATLPQNAQFIPANLVQNTEQQAKSNGKRQPIIMNPATNLSSSNNAPSMVYAKNMRVPVTSFVNTNGHPLTYLPIQNLNGVKNVVNQSQVINHKRSGELANNTVPSKKVKSE